MKKHLVILTPGFCNGGQDTTSMVFLQNLIRVLNDSYAHVKISVIAFQYPYTSTPFLWHGNSVIPLNGKSSKLKRPLTWLKAMRSFADLHKKDPVSGILCLWLTECSLIGQRLANRHKLPLLCWTIGQDAKPGNRYFRYLRLKPEQIAVMAAHQKELLKKSGITCNAVIENGIVPEFFPKPEKNKNASIHIFGVGSLIPLKNYSELIEIVSQITKLVPDLYCEIAGEGPEKEKLQQEINEKDLSKQIILTGPLPHAQVLQKMQQSLIFLHPSVYEGNSTVMIEAAYAGNYLVYRKGIADYRSPLVNAYSSADEAAALILDILKKGNVKPESDLIASMRRSAEQITNILGLA